MQEFRQRKRLKNKLSQHMTINKTENLNSKLYDSNPKTLDNANLLKTLMNGNGILKGLNQFHTGLTIGTIQAVKTKRL